MKRMNEVFELPVTGRDMRNLIKEETTYEDDDSIAHAINHVDALNDALQNLMNMLGGASKDCGHEFHCVCPYEKAAAALKAYRGEK